MLTGGDGAYVFDSRGRRFLNAYSGLSLPLGLGCRPVVEAICKQARNLAYAALYGSTHPLAEEYAALLGKVVPGGPWTVLFTNSGSEAIDAAVKVVKHYWSALGMSRFDLLALDRAYHGQTVGAISLSGVYREGPLQRLPRLMENVRFAPTPFCERCPFNAEPQTCSLPCATQMEAMIDGKGKEPAAALFIEPVIGAGGVIVPPRGYFDRIGAAIERTGSLLVMDESATAAGRTGAMFGMEATGLTPDLVVLAKGVNGGYLPLGALLIRDRIMEVLLATGAGQTIFGPSQGGNPVACAAGIAAMGLIEEHRIWVDALEMGEQLRSGIRCALPSGMHARVRGRGLMVGIELCESSSDNVHEHACRVRDRMRDSGVLVYARENWIGVFPSLTVGVAEVTQIVNAFKLAINAEMASRK